jgi:hypothetical protein
LNKAIIKALECKFRGLFAVVFPAIPNSEILRECGTVGLPSPQPSPKFGRGSKKLSFSLRLPFSQNWEQGLKYTQLVLNLELLAFRE